MLDVTYIGPVAFENFDLGADLLSLRVMENILSKQKNINVTYSDIPIISKIYCQKNKLDDDINSFFNKILSGIKDEYILLTAITNIHLDIITILLNNNKKVVVGGPLTKLYSCNEIRNLLSQNVDKSLLKNLIIIKPYIGLDFDFYKVIKEWKDVEDDSYDLSGIFETNHDFYLEKINTLNDKDIKINNIQIIFNTDCIWGRCTFCSQQHNYKIDFLKSIDIKKYTDSIIYIAKKYNIKVIAIMDPILVFRKKIIEILKILKESGLILAAYSNITTLTNEKYFNNAIKYIDVIRIGIESMSDFQLKEIKKGYTYDDVKFVLNKILLTKPKNIFNILLISNLPAYDEKDVIKNYSRIAKWKLLLNENNINFIFKLPTLQLYKDTEINKSKYLRGAHLKEDKDIVNETIYNYVLQDIFDEFKIKKYIDKAIKRFNGK